mmetsp:Transcript_49977/g.116675  ORF Transcript_49977/g.116675 Transcript_49977/m.116675 type:complete len:120 (+) Transcript_49977:563-922(+)
MQRKGQLQGRAALKHAVFPQKLLAEPRLPDHRLKKFLEARRDVWAAPFNLVDLLCAQRNYFVSCHVENSKHRTWLDRPTMRDTRSSMYYSPFTVKRSAGRHLCVIPGLSRWSTDWSSQC